MRIARTEVVTYQRAVEGVRGAAERWSERAGLLLRLVTTDGRVGQGEASPLPRYSADTLDEARRALERIDPAALPEPGTTEPVDDYLVRLGAAVPALPPSATFGLETALLDLVGQERHVPIWALFEGASPEPVPLSAFIGGADDPDCAVRAAAAARRGIGTVKAKITGPVLGEQLVALARIREAAAGLRLRLDANRTFASDGVRSALQSLRTFEPELVEEPAPLPALLTMGTAPVPLALDESLQESGTKDVLEPRLGTLGWVAVVLKPMALGGFSGCGTLARRAVASGLDVTVSHLFDGPIALAAAAHLALVVASRSRASGLELHGGLGAWPAVRVPLIGATTVVAGSMPGLGLPLLPEPT